MRKWAILGIVILVTVVVLICAAVWNVAGIGTSMHNLAQDSIVTPFCNLITGTWVNIGDMGFLYITITALIISIAGGLFWTIIFYGLIWKKGIQGKLLGKGQEPTVPLASMQRTTSTNLTPVQEVPKPEEKEAAAS
jgi:hypothetical protein